MSLASSLQGAVAACREAQQSCEMTADAGVAICADQFESCRDEAKAEAKPEIDKTVDTCAEASKTCRESAQTSDAKAACAETLRSCLGEERADASAPADKPERDAGGKPDDVGSPVLSCIDALHTCIEGDTPAHDCTDALRDCIAMTVGHNGNPDAGRPDDAGKPDMPGMNGDAGKPEKPEVDAGAPSADAGATGMSKACKEAQDACLAAGGARETCAREAKDCRMP